MKKLDQKEVVGKSNFLFVFKIWRITFPPSLCNSFMCSSKLLLLLLVLFKTLLGFGDFHSQN